MNGERDEFLQDTMGAITYAAMQKQNKLLEKLMQPRELFVGLSNPEKLCKDDAAGLFKIVYKALLISAKYAIIEELERVGFAQEHCDANASLGQMIMLKNGIESNLDGVHSAGKLEGITECIVLLAEELSGQPDNEH